MAGVTLPIRHWPLGIGNVQHVTQNVVGSHQVLVELWVIVGVTARAGAVLRHTTQGIGLGCRRILSIIRLLTAPWLCWASQQDWT